MIHDEKPLGICDLSRISEWDVLLTALENLFPLGGTLKSSPFHQDCPPKF